jgi:Helix-hairpin-helix motif
MGILHQVLRLFRFVLLAAAVATVLISIKACSNPSAEQPTAPPSAMNSPASTGAAAGKPKININSAILSELDKLEAQLGVPALSHKIQASRPYANPEALVSKKVVTQEQFDQIKDQITIEEIVLTGEAKDVDYMTKLGLMKGHMLVASELLALKKPDQAEPHIGHPVEEIYVELEEQLGERKVPEFKAILSEVQDLVKSKPDDAQIPSKFDQAMRAIDTAIDSLPETQRQTPSFAMQVINGLLETATAEYTAAIANGKIQAVIEYQDSRGFVEYAEGTVFKGIEAKIKQANPKVGEQIIATFSKLKKAWPGALAPAAPVFTPDEVAAKVKQIEMSGETVLKASAS